MQFMTLAAAAVFITGTLALPGPAVLMEYNRLVARDDQAANVQAAAAGQQAASAQAGKQDTNAKSAFDPRYGFDPCIYFGFSSPQCYQSQFPPYPPYYPPPPLYPPPYYGPPYYPGQGPFFPGQGPFFPGQAPNVNVNFPNGIFPGGGPGPADASGGPLGLASSLLGGGGPGGPPPGP